MSYHLWREICGIQSGCRNKFIEESGVGVANKDHVDDAISDAVVGVGGNVVEKLVDRSGSVFGDGLLLCADTTEC